MQFQQAYSYLIPQLEEKLAACLTYHNAEHTKEVIQAAQHIAAFELIDEEELQLLLTAALFHDAGFLEDYDNHEEASAELAKKVLQEFDYTEEEIDTVCRLIMATKLPHHPANKLEAVLCDADLYYLGTNHYFRIAENLFNELKEKGLIKSREAWQKKQIEFLESHRYFTDTGIKEYEFCKQKNLNLLKLNRNEKPSKTNRPVVTGIKDSLSIIFGVLLAGFALEGFLVPNHFFDGGITGISLLLQQIFGFNLSYTVILLNLPLVIASYYTVNKPFALKTFISILLLGLCILYVHFPVITSDKLLISIFGGFFLGMGVGLIMRVGGALDGTEVLALYTLRRTSFTIAEIIFGINVLIFAVAGFEFGIETSLYSILTYFTASRTIDYVIEGIEAYTGVTIISANSEMIKHRLVKELGRGITVYKGERGYLPEHFEISNQCDIIFTVISRLELRKLKNVVIESDPKAFVFANTIKEASGGIISRRHAH